MRRGPVFGLRWSLPEMPEEPQPRSHLFRPIPPTSLNKFPRPRISRLPQPEHRLLPYFRVLVLFRNLNQLGHSFLLWHLAQREHSFLLHFRVRIICDCSRDRTLCLRACLLRQPEKRLSANVSASVLTGHPDHLLCRSRFLADKHGKTYLGPHVAAWICLGHLFQLHQASCPSRGSHPE